MFSRLFARIAGVVGLLLAITLLAAGPLTAQGNVDYILGTITDATGKPVAGAGIEALSLELQVTKKTTTNDKGKFSLVFNEGGGQYRITVRAIGKLPMIQNVTRQADDDRIVFNVKLGEQATRVQDLVARAASRPDPNALDRPTPGSTERNMTADQASRLPIDASDLATLASLAPGVIFTGGTDSTGSSFSVAGQSAESNSFVIDGLTSASGSVPADAIRSTRVTTNTYDVSRGGFSGGQVSATTRGGSNRTAGTLSGNFQNQNLALGGTQTVFGSGNTTENLGAGFGGPIKKDKLFLYGSFNVNRGISPIATLDLADPTTLSRLGASADSVNKFISLVNQTGYTTAVGAIDPNRTNDRIQALSRFDWNAADRSTVSLSWSLGVTTSDPFRTSTTSLPQVGGNQKGSSGGVSLSTITRMNVDLTNEFRAGFSYNNSSSDPFLSVPSGRVTNYSTLDSGRIATTTLGFGGNSGLPTHNNTKSIQATNTLSFTPSGSHRFQLGLGFDRSTFDQDVTSNRFGTYSYNSLADFQNNIPSTFTRTLSPTVWNGSANNESVFLSDVWRSGASRSAGNTGGAGGRGGGFGGGSGSGNLQVTAGVRVERSGYGGAPALNQDVETKFGVRTDQLPSELYVSPRLGFSFNIPAKEQMGNGQRGFAPPLLTLRGGLGVFRGTMPATLPGSAQAQSGLLNTESQLFCVGSAVPIPTWSNYLNDPAQIPSQCIDNASTPVLTGVPNITTYASDYGAPKTYRASFGLSKRLTQLLSFTLDASYVRGKGQAATRDLNLNEAARFTVGGLDGRPNYSDPTKIITTTGATPLSASRKYTDYGSVSQVFAALQNETKQVTLSVSGSNRRAASINLSYTMMFARDQGGSGGGFGGRGGSGGGAGGGNVTAGDPNLYEWGVSSGERRHNFQVNVSWPFNQTFTLTANGNLTSGSHYTPTVQGDINGDGASRNDRAFIYNPATTADTGVANGMTRMLAATSGGARSCIEAQLGQIAGRNTCTGPWSPSLDFQLNVLPPFLNHRLTMSLATSNFLGGLDEFIHGENNIKGWGRNAVNPSSTLLTVRGFDATSNTFKYQVNERFGATTANTQATRAPMQLSIRMRYVIGYDQQRARMQSFFQGSGTAPSGMQVLADGIKRFQVENVASVALAQKDSLALTAGQVADLQKLRDSTLKAMAPMLDSLTKEVDKVNKAGSAANIQPLFMMLGPLNQSTTRLRDAVKAILTDVQWTLLPEAVRNGTNFFNTGTGGRGAGGAGGGGGGRGGRGGGE